MQFIVIKQTKPELGRDTKVFRAYSSKSGVSWQCNPLGVSASCTSQAVIGARRCAEKAFLKFGEPDADPDELATRILLEDIGPGLWRATLAVKLKL